MNKNITTVNVYKCKKNNLLYLRFENDNFLLCKEVDDGSEDIFNISDDILKKEFKLIDTYIEFI